MVLVVLVEDVLVCVLTWLLNGATIDVLRDDVASEGELKSQSLVVPVATSLTGVVGHFAGELENAILRECEKLTVVVDGSMSGSSNDVIT